MTSSWEHPGYGAGPGNVTRSESACPCGRGRIVEEHDNIPGFRSHDEYLSCETCRAAQLAIVWEQNGADGLRDFGSARPSYPQPSYPQIGEWIVEHADLVEHVNSHMALLRDTHAAIGAAFILARIDPTAELEFFTALGEGALPKGNPITVLGRHLNDRRASVYVRDVDRFGMIFQTWNAWRNGEPMGKLDKASELTSFPVPV